MIDRKRTQRILRYETAGFLLLIALSWLNELVRLCAWCRKIGHEDMWSTVEDYFARGFAIKTSHGMCPECQAKWAEETKRRAA